MFVQVLVRLKTKANGTYEVGYVPLGWRLEAEIPNAEPCRKNALNPALKPAHPYALHPAAASEDLRSQGLDSGTCG